MQVIKPIEITDSIMTSTIPEPDSSVWEVEWEDKATRVQQVVTNSFPTGYNYANHGAMYITSDTTKRYYVPMRANGSVTSWSISTYDADFNFVSTIALTGPASDNCKLIGATYLAIYNEISLVWRDEASPYTYYRQSFSVSAETQGTETALSGIPSLLLDPNMAVRFATFSDMSFVASYINYTAEGSYKLYSDGSVSVSSNVNIGYLSQYDEYVYSSVIKATSGGYSLSINKYDKTLSYISNIETDIDVPSLLSNSIAGINISNDVICVLFRTSSTFQIHTCEMDGAKLGRYEIGDKVIKTSTHKLYQCAVKTFDDPETGVLLTPPTWVEVSATNKYRAFDYIINTKAAHNSTVGTFIFTPGAACTTVALFGMENVTRVYVNVYEDDENGDLIYNSAQYTEISAPTDDGLVNESLYIDKVIFDDLPAYSNPYIKVSFNKSEDLFYIGDIVIGNPRTLGFANYESSTSRTSYDTVTTDDFGNETIVSRPSAEYTTFEVSVKKDYADYVERILKDSLNKPRVWVGNKMDDEKLFTLGYYKRSPLTYSSPSYFDISLKIRGLV